ncbi:tetratricopeptide repeat protein [Sorangium sp. So ce513]|uniref:tetratricopeptide repeat protein n=1 Tax=Sorangium sp. So ce513 TaxID=3133315 RepID=UPI003F63B9D5
MIKVECDGCKSPYQVDEKRVPPAGLRMRCPKCGTSLLVTKGGAAPSPPPAPAPAPTPAPRAGAGGLQLSERSAPAMHDDADLPVAAPEDVAFPAVAPPRRPGPAPVPTPPRRGAQTAPAAPGAIAAAAPAPPAPRPEPPGPEVFGEIGLPDVPDRPAPSDRRNAKTVPQRRGFGEIDLMVELPSPADVEAQGLDPDDLPVVYGNAPTAPSPSRSRAESRTAPATPSAFAGADLPARVDPLPPSSRRTLGFGPRDSAFNARDSGLGAFDSGPGARDSSPGSRAGAATQPLGRGRTRDMGDAAPPRVAPEYDFGDLDDDAPPAPPARSSSGSRSSGSMSFGFGELELPLEGDGDPDLPSPSAGDLPIVAGDLPSSVPGVIGMPAPFPGAGLPAPASAPLPSPVRAGLPAPTAAGLPAAASAGFPAPASAGFPAPATAGFPATAPAGFPAPATAGFPAHAAAGVPAKATGPGLPSRATGTGSPAGPGTIVGAELFDEAPPDYDDSRVGAAFQAPGPRPLPPTAPEPPSGGGMPSTDFGTPSTDFGTPSTDFGMPSTDFGTPSTDFGMPSTDFGMPSTNLGTPSTNLGTSSTNLGMPPADFGGEIALGESATPLAGGAVPAVYDPSDRSANFTQTPAGVDDRGIELSEPHPSVGDEVDLTGAGTEIGDLSAGSEAQVEKPAPAQEAPPPKTKVKRYVVAALAIAAVAGGALALVPDVGAFGVNLISDRLNASAHEEALADLRKRTQAALAKDTASAANGALNDARAAREAAPRHRATMAYAGYVAFARGIRFGQRTVDDAFGKEMVTLASSNPGDLLSLAAAAQDAATGQLPRARQGAQALGAQLKDDIDVAVLAAEIELLAGDAPKAIEAWQRANALQKSARTLFGLARAQRLAGDAAAAEASAKGALEASPNHVGARTLIASLVWQTPAREQEALDLLGKVTGDGPVRAAASDPELVEAYTLLGSIHLTRSRMSAAEQAFAAAVKIDPQAVRALIGNGEVLYRSGRYSEAQARFEAAARADAKNLAAHIGKAKTWLAQERMKEAKDLLKGLQKTHAADPQVAYWLGRAELALGNKKEAEQAYLEAVRSSENRPEVVDAYVALSSLLSSLERNEEAAAKLSEATAKFPDLPALHKAKAEVALQTGRYEEARQELELALAKEDDLDSQFKLGEANRRLGRFEEAGKIFDKVSAADKDYPGLALVRGLLFEETGQSERALEMYADALRKAPNDVDLKLRVGSTQVMAGHASQAEPMLRDVLKDRPTSAEAHHFLGRALLVRGTNVAEALRLLERAAELDPNRAEYHLYVGWGANETGQTARAEVALKRALELDANLGDAYWQRGVLLQKQGASRDALADLQIALQKRPSRYEAYATMALCYQDQGNWAAAEDAWRKAIAANDKVPEWHYRLGKIYASRGNRAGAAAELEQAVALGEAPERSAPPWLFDAHFLLAEALRATNDREKAIRHYQRFLETAPTDNAYRRDAAQALQSLGAGKGR